jgi:four helix bundle protein
MKSQIINNKSKTGKGRVLESDAYQGGNCLRSVVEEPSANASYDLEERTFKFACEVRILAKRLKKTMSNCEDMRQLIKASGSVGANYIEANEALSKKDFILRIRISRKEARESHYWLRLIDTKDERRLDDDRVRLKNEATELTRIFSAILAKFQPTDWRI